jgi:hypothetical protein
MHAKLGKGEVWALHCKVNGYQAETLTISQRPLFAMTEASKKKTKKKQGKQTDDEKENKNRFDIEQNTKRKEKMPSKAVIILCRHNHRRKHFAPSMNESSDAIIIMQ